MLRRKTWPLVARLAKSLAHQSTARTDWDGAVELVRGHHFPFKRLAGGKDPFDSGREREGWENPLFFHLLVTIIHAYSLYFWPEAGEFIQIQIWLEANLLIKFSLNKVATPESINSQRQAFIYATYSEKHSHKPMTCKWWVGPPTPNHRICNNNYSLSFS